MDKTEKIVNRSHLVGAILWRHRLNMGLSQVDVAKQMGAVHSVVARIERGRFALTLDQVLGFTRAVDINLAEVVEGVERVCARYGLKLSDKRACNLSDAERRKAVSESRRLVNILFEDK